VRRTPIMAAMCVTCPFREGSPFAYLAPVLTDSALTHASRICHSTGSNAIQEHTGKPERICRGARNVQLESLHRSGFLDAPTDEAWERKCLELGIPPDQRKGCS
jgi:hypothetical protein